MNDLWPIVVDVIAGACLLGGSFLSFAAGMGVRRFPDLLSRIHAATKPQVLGLLLMLLGLALRLQAVPVIWMLVLVALFQMLTSPVAAHMVSRAGYRTGKVRFDLLVVDELTRDLDAARAEVAGESRTGDAASAGTSAQELRGTPRGEDSGERDDGARDGRGEGHLPEP